MVAGLSSDWLVCRLNAVLSHNFLWEKEISGLCSFLA